MKFAWVLAVTALFCVILPQNLSSATDEIEDAFADEEDDGLITHREIQKRAGASKLTKWVLKRVARELRQNGPLARRFFAALENYTGQRVSASKVADLLDAVVKKMDFIPNATCELFVDASIAYGIGIDRATSFKICHAILDILI